MEPISLIQYYTTTNVNGLERVSMDVCGLKLYIYRPLSIILSETKLPICEVHSIMKHHKLDGEVEDHRKRRGLLLAWEIPILNRISVG